MRPVPERPTTPASVKVGAAVLGVVGALLILSWISGLVFGLIKLVVTIGIIGLAVSIAVRLMGQDR